MLTRKGKKVLTVKEILDILSKKDKDAHVFIGTEENPVEDKQGVISVYSSGKVLVLQS